MYTPLYILLVPKRQTKVHSTCSSQQCSEPPTTPSIRHDLSHLSPLLRIWIYYIAHALVRNALDPQNPHPLSKVYAMTLSYSVVHPAESVALTVNGRQPTFTNDIVNRKDTVYWKTQHWPHRLDKGRGDRAINAIDHKGWLHIIHGTSHLRRHTQTCM